MSNCFSVNMDDNNGTVKKKNRKYNEATLKAAIESVLESKLFFARQFVFKGFFETLHVRRIDSKKENQGAQQFLPMAYPYNRKVQKKGKPDGTQKCQSSTSEDDWVCRYCSGSYSQDVKLKNVGDWITCSFCANPYHTHCQSQIIGNNQAVYMCDSCSIDDLVVKIKCTTKNASLITLHN